MKAKLALCGALVLCFFLGVFGFEASARIGMREWNYQELKTNAPIIVIATPVAVKVLDEQGNIPWLNEAGQVQMFSDVHRKEVETTFRILTVLKGELATNKLVLHSFEYTGRPDGSVTVYTDSMPHLVSFETDGKKSYLLFLPRQSDGRFIPVSSHYDASFAIKELGESNPVFRPKQ